MKIAFVDLPRQNKKYYKVFNKAFNTVVSRADFIQGETLDKFEKSFAQYCGKKYCVGLNSGTDALLFALIAYGIGPGDEVITAPNSYFSTAMVIQQVGAKAVFADIDPTSYNIDPSCIPQKITSRTRAIIPIHMYGQPANMDQIVSIAKKHSLHIIEDCCQAHGAYFKGTRVPYTETGAFSFYPGKNLGSFGDGGALVTDNKRVAAKAELLRNDGSKKKYIHELFGYKSRLDTLQAAILSAKLENLDTWNTLRESHARSYTKLLQNVIGITTPQIVPGNTHVFHIYAIAVEKKRDQLKKYLEKTGIACVIHYPIPIHLQLPFRKLGYKPGDFPITEKTVKQIISLPMFPELKLAEIHYVTKTIRMFLNTELS